MQNFPFNRQSLNQRHRLSHQQIDELLNEKCSNEHLPEKYGQLFQVSEFIKLTDELGLEFFTNFQNKTITDEKLCLNP